MELSILPRLYLCTEWDLWLFWADDGSLWSLWSDSLETTTMEITGLFCVIQVVLVAVNQTQKSSPRTLSCNCLMDKLDSPESRKIFTEHFPCSFNDHYLEIVIHLYSCFFFHNFFFIFSLSYIYDIYKSCCYFNTLIFYMFAYLHSNSTLV